MFETSKFGDLIREVEVTRKTEHSVWVKATYKNNDGSDCINRYKKKSEYNQFWETKKEAKDYLTEVFENQIAVYESMIERTKEDLEKVKNF